MASGLALYVCAARQSRSDRAMSSRSQNRCLRPETRMSCADIRTRSRAREHELVASAFSSKYDRRLCHGIVGIARLTSGLVILEAGVLRFRLFWSRRGRHAAWVAGRLPALPACKWPCRIIYMLSHLRFQSGRAAHARRTQGGAQRPSRKLRSGCYVTLTANLEARWRVPPRLRRGNRFCAPIMYIA